MAMMEQIGTVIDTDATSLWVETQPVSGCSSCASSAGSCSTAVVSKLFAERRTQLRLPNSLDARTGDRVVIGIPERALLRAALWAYLLPPLLMIGAAATVQQLGGTETMQGLWGVAGLVAGFIWLRSMNRGQGGRDPIRPRLLRLASGSSGVNVMPPSHSGAPPEQPANGFDDKEKV